MSIAAVPATAAAAAPDDVPGVWTCADVKESDVIKGAVTGTGCKGPEGHYAPGSIFTGVGAWHCLSAFGTDAKDSFAVGGLGCTKD
ncbi:hypothetical protein [Streptomyces mesophilus]|uniref:hypothetical protein n=1 Tax=Streptomyces mesophilus TaxID=1775132 RepID=UPI00332D2142